ncbi:MAG: flagellar export chaperone FliS [Deferribacteraceae bacterium]|jgi:flagellar protein FliS|nr:flagellar export chaperone FliS [Deferribacteraceae bacterium]
MANAYQNYLRQEIEGASQTKIVVLLYEAAIKFMRNSVRSIEDKNIEDTHNNLVRAQNIIYELMSTLNKDDGGSIAEELMKLYEYMLWQLEEANTAKDTAAVHNVIKIITPLKDAWKEVAARESEPKKELETKPINLTG